MKVTINECEQIRELLPGYVKKFMGTAYPAAGKWGQQYWKTGAKDVEFVNMKTPMTQEDLLNCFFGKFRDSKNARYGGLAMVGSFSEQCKWYCLDVDLPEAVQETRDKIIPMFETEEIPYIWEYGGPARNKAHIWVFFDWLASIKQIEKFVETILRCAEMYGRKELKLEHYPIFNKKNNLIRLPGMLHLRSNSVNSVDDHNGREHLRTPAIMKAFIECPEVSMDQMLNFIKKYAPAPDMRQGGDPLNVLKDLPIYESSNKPRIYRKLPKLKRRNLGTGNLYKRNAPPLLDLVLNECQAMHNLQNRIAKGLMDEDNVHDEGFLFGQIFEMEHRLARRDPERRKKIEEFATWWLTEYRHRPSDRHNWRWTPGDGKAYLPNCETLENRYHDCEGCQYRNRDEIRKPWNLVHLEKGFLKPVSVQSVAIGTAESIHAKNYAIVRELLLNAIEDNKDLKLAWRDPRGTFKTTGIVNLATELAKGGKFSLIAEPNAAIAMEVKERIEFTESGTRTGLKVLVLLSRKTAFEHLVKDKFACPYDEDIDTLQEIGAGTKSITEWFCKNCPFKNECPFPGQYTKADSGQYKVIVIQHAHFKTNVMSLLSGIRFAAMFIDETFIDSTFELVTLSKDERALLTACKSQYPWIESILNWVDGEPANRRLIIDEQGMLDMHKKYEKQQIRWNLRLFVDAYESKKAYIRDVGVFRFYPIPKHSRLVMTDGTLPMSLVCTVMDLHTDAIRVVGGDVLIDVKAYNPKNKIIKVLDGRNSRSAMSNPKYFQMWLHYIGIMARTEWKDLTILVTVFKDQKDAAEKFFEAYYEEVKELITVSTLTVGVNTWKDTNVQVQLAGVYLNAKTAAEWEWKFKEIENYWRAANGETELHNPFPTGIHPTAFDYNNDDAMSQMPLRMHIRNTSASADLIEFDQIKKWTNINGYEAMAEQLTNGTTEQAKRIRTHDDSLKITVDLSVKDQKGVCYTDWVLEADEFARTGVYDLVKKVDIDADFQKL